MTDTGGQQSPAGWYADPMGSGQSRWWDGSAWTTELAPLAMPETTQVARKAAPRYWNSMGVWFVAISPIYLSVPTLIYSAATGSLPTAAYGLGTFIGVGFIPFMISALFAGNDRKMLEIWGYTRPASTWWMLLTPVAYLVIRTVKVYRETRHGLAPLITYIVASLVAVVTLLAGFILLAPILTETSGEVDSHAVSAQIQKGMDSRGGNFSVTCPATISLGVGSVFSCTAIDEATNTAHVLAIEVVAGSGGRPTLELDSITPPITTR